MKIVIATGAAVVCASFTPAAMDLVWFGAAVGPSRIDISCAGTSSCDAVDTGA